MTNIVVVVVIAIIIIFLFVLMGVLTSIQALPLQTAVWPTGGAAIVLGGKGAGVGDYLNNIEILAEPGVVPSQCKVY